MSDPMITENQEEVRIPDELAVLPLRDMVVYPFIIAPLSVARPLSIQAVDQALSENRMILLTSQKDKDNDDPDGEDLYTTGTVAVIMRMLKLPDGRIRVLVQGVCRARITEVTGMEGDVITMQDIFSFEQIGVTPSGKAYGRFVSTGIRPALLDRLKTAGCEIDPTSFTRKVLMEDDPT